MEAARQAQRGRDMKKRKRKRRSKEEWQSKRTKIVLCFVRF